MFIHFIRLYLKLKFLPTLITYDKSNKQNKRTIQLLPKQTLFQKEKKEKTVKVFEIFKNYSVPIIYGDNYL